MTTELREHRGRLGTFAGVFTPSIMTILGIILFMRLGFVVGNAGLGGTLAILAIATVISTLTSISLSAIATNMRVKGGGDYYLISRTLGIEFGGAIGIVLYLAQSVSVAFYSIGFGEVLGILTGREDVVFSQIAAAVGILALFVLAWFGTDAATRFQYVVMAVMGIALVSFYLGAAGDFDPGRLRQAWHGVDDGLRFWVVFAIFFPAVTGFTQGVSMSGELRDPARSLPTGTFAAVGLSTVVYASVAVMLAGVFTAQFLVDNTDALNQAAVVPWLVDAGVITATLSSAMASLMGAPRILQSLATDRIFPFLNWFSAGSGPTNNPRRALLLTLAIALGTVSLGSVDVIAPVVSMFFLISYGLLNYATAYEASSGSPSFRPRFRWFDRRLSRLGSALCLVAMVLINATTAALALAVLWAIHRYVASRPLPERWSDAAYSHHFQKAKESIRDLAGETPSPRNWRPQLILFTSDAERGERVMRFGSWLEGDAGLSAVIRVVTGSGALKRRQADELQQQLRTQIAELGVASHPRVLVAPNAVEALPVIVQAFGVGPLKANTAVFGWAQDGGADQARRLVYGRAMMEVLRYGVNAVTVSTDAARWQRLEAMPPAQRRIDVWWSDDDAGRLSLLAAYLFTRNGEWSRATIRLLVGAGEDPAAAVAEAEAMLDEARIRAEVEPVTDHTASGLAARSADAGFVMLTMRAFQSTLLDPFGGDLYPLMESLPLAATFTTRTSVDLAAGPESGSHALLVAAEERVATIIRRRQRLAEAVEKAEDRVEDLRGGAADGAIRPGRDLEEALEDLEDLRRKLLVAQTAVDQAKAEAQALKPSR